MEDVPVFHRQITRSDLTNDHPRQMVFRLSVGPIDQEGDPLGNWQNNGLWRVYQKRVPTRMMRVEGPFTVETSEGPLTCQDGFVAMDARGYPYPITAEEQALIYGPVPENSMAAPGLGIGSAAVHTLHGYLGWHETYAPDQRLIERTLRTFVPTAVLKSFQVDKSQHFDYVEVRVYWEIES